MEEESFAVSVTPEELEVLFLNSEDGGLDSPSVDPIRLDDLKKKIAQLERTVKQQQLELNWQHCLNVVQLLDEITEPKASYETRWRKNPSLSCEEQLKVVLELSYQLGVALFGNAYAAKAERWWIKK